MSLLRWKASLSHSVWVFRSYSPWGYAPAFNIHDWLFEMHHCKYNGYENFEFEDAAWIMSEIMKTMILKDNNSPPDSFTLYTMFEAVNSPIARKLWDSEKCIPPPAALTGFSALQGSPKPIKEYLIEFP